jgi:pilus assembly protein Flp/PilA
MHNDTVLKLYVKLTSLKHALLHDERGQDLIEYALVVALIALAATAGMSSVATSISTAFSKIASRMTTYTS